MGLLQADFNDANIIVRRGEDGIPHPTAVIDFGDAVHSWRVNDVAIAMAYVTKFFPSPHIHHAAATLAIRDSPNSSFKGSSRML